MPTMQTRENEFWTPEVMWRGQPAFVVASGPSVAKIYLECLRGYRTIVVNSTSYRMPWADVLFFTDGGWYDRRKAHVDNFAGMVVTLSRSAKRDNPDKFKRVIGRVENYKFPPIGSEWIRQGRSSGQIAAALALAFGASPIILLGFDMSNDDSGRSHEHDDYGDQRTPQLLFRDEFLPAWQGWNKQALDIGVTILNATHPSDLEEFPFVRLEDVLREVLPV